jgi:ADP-heptose:LPS heptosyltransferase
MNTPPSTYFFFSFGAIGDTLLLLALTEAIHDKSPQARFVIMTTKNAPLLLEIAQAYPFVRVVNIEKWHIFLNGLREAAFSPRKAFVITPPTFRKVLIRIQLLSWLLSFKPKSKNIGYYYKGELVKNLYSDILPLDPQMSLFNALCLIGQVSSLDIKPPPSLFRYEPTLPQTEKTEPYIVIHPLAASNIRNMPPSMLLFIIETVFKYWPSKSGKIIITGSSKDHPVIEQMLSSYKTSPRIEIMCGKNFTKLATMIGRCLLFIGTDTGVTHLASCLRKPSIVIGNLICSFTLPTYNPYAEILVNKEHCTCSGDKQKICKVYLDNAWYAACMATIPPEQIEQSIRRKLK